MNFDLATKAAHSTAWAFAVFCVITSLYGLVMWHMEGYVASTIGLISIGIYFATYLLHWINKKRRESQ